jgi:hypothetical protein
MQPSPNGRRVGIRIVTFEACSSFTHVTAHRIAQSPKATFVTRLQPCRLPSRAARQLPDQSTILRVESSSTDDSRLRGARPKDDITLGSGSSSRLRIDRLRVSILVMLNRQGRAICQYGEGGRQEDVQRRYNIRALADRRGHTLDRFCPHIADRKDPTPRRFQ